MRMKDSIVEAGIDQAEGVNICLQDMSGARSKKGDSPLLLANEVEKMTTLDGKTIARLISQERFPTPLQLSDRRRAWRRSEVDCWLSDPFGWVNF